MNPAAAILVQMARDTERAIATEWDLFLLALGSCLSIAAIAARRFPRVIAT